MKIATTDGIVVDWGHRPKGITYLDSSSGPSINVDLMAMATSDQSGGHGPAYFTNDRGQRVGIAPEQWTVNPVTNQNRLVGHDVVITDASISGLFSPEESAEDPEDRPFRGTLIRRPGTIRKTGS